MLRAVPGEAKDLANELDHRVHPGCGRIEAGGAHTVGGGLRQCAPFDEVVARSQSATAPSVDLVREAVDRVGGEPERLADIADRASPPIADDLADERGTIAAVLRVDVLDDLLAPLMLEVNVDVGRLVAFAAHEALEEDIDPVWIHRRDAERVADGAVGGRAAPLAEDAAGARKGNDVVHGQEVRRIAEVVDDGELVLELARDLGGDAARIAFASALPHQIPEVLHRRHALWHDFVRVLVAQLVERERRCALEETPGGLERIRAVTVSAKDLDWRAQTPLCMLRDLPRRAIDRDAVADARQRVEQRLA